MIRRDELDRMQRGLDSLVVDSQSVASTELRSIEGFAGRPAPDEVAVTIRWRVGLSSAPPSTFRVAVTTDVGELLTEILRQTPSLRQRAPWRVATITDDVLQPLPEDAPLDALGVEPGGSVALVLIPDERLRNCSITGDARARAFAARASSSRDLFAAEPDKTLEEGQRDQGFTLLYRIGRTRAAPRAIRGGPKATVLDVLEEIAEQEPAVEIRLKAGERVQLARGEDQEVLQNAATLETLGFRPGGTFPVYVL